MLYAKNYKLYAYNDINDFSIVKKYFEYSSLYKSETTIATYESSIKSFYIFYINQLKEKNIKCKDYIIKSIEQKIIEDFITFELNKKLSSDFIITKITAIKDYLKYLSKIKIISTQKFFNIFDDLKLPKRNLKNQICRKSKDAIELLRKIKDDKYRDEFTKNRNMLMIMLLSNTGIRKKELAGINANEINFKDNTITLYKTKNSKARVVGFSESIKIYLIDYLKQRANILKRHNREDASFLIKSSGSDLKINSIGKIMQRISKKHNIKITCHSFRRGFATDMAENKTDIYLISKMLGHANINTTASRYIQVFSSSIKEAMKNHPFSQVSNRERAEIENKNIENENLTKEEIILKINLLMQETNKLVKMLEKRA